MNINQDVAKCESQECINKDSCYRYTKSQSTMHDFGRICGEDFKWYIKDKTVDKAVEEC